MFPKVPNWWSAPDAGLGAQGHRRIRWGRSNRLARIARSACCIGCPARPARIEAGGSLELRPLQQAPGRRTNWREFRRLFSLAGRRERVKGPLRSLRALDPLPPPSLRRGGDAKMGGLKEEEKTLLGT